jgi:cupin fold WbuC family metalloprotein
MAIDNTIWVGDVISSIDGWNLSAAESELNGLAEESPKKRSRLCFHKSPCSGAQFMLIQALKTSFIPIHKHKNSYEAYIPIAGKAYLLLFDNNLALNKKILLSGVSDKKMTNCHGVPPNHWHTLVILSDSFKYFEFKESVHNENDIIYDVKMSDLSAVNLLEGLKVGEKI